MPLRHRPLANVSPKRAATAACRAAACSRLGWQHFACCILPHLSHADLRARPVVEQAKAAGGANNDWKLTHSLIHAHKGSDGSSPSLQVSLRGRCRTGL